MGNCIDNSAETQKQKYIISELQEKIKKLEDRFTPPFTSNPSDAFSLDCFKPNSRVNNDLRNTSDDCAYQNMIYNVDNVCLKSSYVLQVEISSNETGEKIVLAQTLHYEMTEVSLKHISKKISMKILSFIGDDKMSTKSYITLYNTGGTVNFYSFISELSKIFSSETPGNIKLSPQTDVIKREENISFGDSNNKYNLYNPMNDTIRTSNLSLFHVQVTDTPSTN